MTKKIATISTFILFAIATLCFSVAAWVYANGNYQYYFDKVEIVNKYSVGDVFVVPECKMYLKNEKFNTSFKVVFPDGRECFEQSFKIEQKGSYKIIYEGVDTVENNTRLNVVEFFVASKLYEMVGNNELVQPVYMQTGYNGTTGIVANIRDGNSLRFNKTIDLSKLTKEEGIIEFFHLPVNVGYLDGFFEITLTDAYDENNSVSILVRKYNENSSDGWYNAYIMVSFNDSDEVGLRFNNNKQMNANSVYYNGAWHQLDKNNDLGTCINYSMIGTPRNNVSLGGETLKFSYDYKEKIIYANGVFVSDLDEVLFYKNIFQGFTTGEVFLSISGFNYSQSTVNPVILSVAQTDISKNVLFDEQAPVISVDTSCFDGQIVGVKDNEFKLFSATAKDKIDGDLAVTTKVYRNYYSSRIFVPIFDGKFLPDVNTKYYIEYSATDFSGNKAKKVVEVDVLDKAQPLDFSVDGLNLANIKAGESVRLFNGVNIFGDVYGNDINVKAVVKHLGNGEQYLLDNSYSFLPIYGGNYQLSVSVSDYVETKINNYDFSVFAPNSPIFIGEPLIKKYYIKGATYTADDFTAYTTTETALVKSETETYIQEDGGEYVKINETFTVQAHTSIRFKYVAGDSVYYTSEVNVVDVNFGSKLNLANYFYGDVTTQTTKEYVKLTTKNQTNGITKIDFVNSVKAENLTLSLGFDKSESKFEQFNVYITDVYDNYNQIKLSFSADNGITELAVNDGNKIVLSKNYLENDVLYNLNFNNTDKTIKIDDSVVGVKTNYAGKPFEGFAKYDVYVWFEFVGVNETASVNIYEINGQTFNSNDYVLPPIFTHVVCVGEVSIGQTFKVSKIIVDSILDPCVTVSDFYVTTPSGGYAYSIDGVKLDKTADYTKDYYVMAEEYGAYTIYLNAYNSSGVYSYLPVYEEVWVVDMTAPTITFKSQMEKVVSVGSTIKLPEVDISDDYSSSENITLYTVVRFADGTFRTVSDNKFKADEKGEYTVMFVAYDENQNTTVKTVVIKAE